MAHTLGLDELYATYMCMPYTAYSWDGEEGSPLFATRICVYTAAVTFCQRGRLLLVPYMYIVTAVVYGLEKWKVVCVIYFLS